MITKMSNVQDISIVLSQCISEDRFKLITIEATE